MAQNSTWNYTGSFPGYFKVAASVLADGQSVLVTGGTKDPNTLAVCRQAWLYAGSGLACLPPYNMTQPRFGHTSTTLSSGMVLIAGCEANDRSADRAAQTAELYDPGSGQFSATGDLVEARGWHTATLLPSTNEVLIVGGADPALGLHTPKNSAELYNPQTGAFRFTKGSLTHARSRHTATLLPNGKVLIVGGTGMLPYAEVYDPASETFSLAGNLAIGRTNHAATQLNDGRVLIAGGYEYGGTANQCEEVFNVTTNTFSPVAPIQKTVYGLTLSTLLSGKVLAVGGSANYEKFSSLTIDPQTWIFDPTPVVPTFSPSSVCLTRIAYHKAKVLASGCVFFIGGAGVMNTICNQGILYTPDTATLHLRFYGTGYGTVSSIPGGINTTQSIDVPLALGMSVFLTATPASPSFSIGWRKIPATKLRPARWEKVLIHHTHTFDGWGQVAPFDTRNPLEVLIDQDRTIDLTFTEHTRSTRLKLPDFRPMGG
jgi:hypothetical protein